MRPWGCGPHARLSAARHLRASMGLHMCKSMRVLGVWCVCVCVCVGVCVCVCLWVGVCLLLLAALWWAAVAVAGGTVAGGTSHAVPPAPCIMYTCLCCARPPQHTRGTPTSRLCVCVCAHQLRRLRVCICRVHVCVCLCASSVLVVVQPVVRSSWGSMVSMQPPARDAWCCALMCALPKAQPRLLVRLSCTTSQSCCCQAPLCVCVVPPLPSPGAWAVG
jgi:hypothetical protein